LDQRPFFRQCYRRSATFALEHLANIQLAVSAGAAKDLFGDNSHALNIFPCGTDFESLFSTEHRSDHSRFTLVHVGRFVPGKNHIFLLRIMAELAQRKSAARLWLIGDGPLRPLIEQEALSLGIVDRVQFLGNRSDVPELLSVANLFVFPSLSEGLGLAAIEAQAAGLPVLMAGHLPVELDLLPGRCRRLALDLPIHKWVDSILEMSEIPAMHLKDRRAALSQSRFSIDSNIRILSEIYAS
jgi:glycosyltransferase involved in cell wall biosynthesis